MSAIPAVPFSELLRRFRIEAGLTQTDLAGRANVSVRAISDLERGLRQRPRSDTVRLLAKALNLEPADGELLAAAARRLPAQSEESPPVASPEGSQAASAAPLPPAAVSSNRSAPAAPRSAVPVALTSFVGREREIAELRGLLQATRLVTVAGPGGAGKTRLAFRVAAEVAADYPASVFVVQLAALADPALVPQALATALGVRAVGDPALVAAVVARLGPGRALLVLDNCEHLIDACAELVRALLEGCPELRVLATSREGLAVPSEVIWRVPPLAAPNPDLLAGEVPAESITSYTAVQLFQERARSYRPTFAVTARNARAVAEICWRLDGNPLAIELAAARLSVLSPAQIAERLSDQLTLLRGHARAGIPRHQTARALIDWSYSLLAPDEQRMLRHLAVFAGSWALEAAEAIGEPSDVLDLLAQLVNKSLVQVEDDGKTTRYRLLETIRAFAQERLQADLAEWHSVSQRHASLYVTLAERGLSEARGTAQVEWLDRLEAEHANFRTALAWCRENDRLSGLRLAGSLWRFWWLRGYHQEGRRWLARFLADDGDGFDASLPVDRGLDPVTSASARSKVGAGPDDRFAQLARARALHGAGFMALYSGDPGARRFLEEGHALFRAFGQHRGAGDTLRLLARLSLAQGKLTEARQLLEASLAELRQTDDRQGIAGTLSHLATVERQSGNIARARELGEECLAIFKEVKDPLGAGWALVLLGQVARTEGDYLAGSRALEAALASFRMVGYRVGVAWAQGHLGIVTLRLGDLGRARALLEESLATFREGAYRPAETGGFGEGLGASWALSYLGYVALAAGDLDRAQAYLDESLALCRDAPERESDYWSRLCLAAGLAGERGDYERATRLLGAVVGAHPVLSSLLDPVERGDYDGGLAACRAALGEARFEQAWAVGQTMPLEVAFAEARVR
jgi:non-specific serine/threonine protein kinase